jgi:glycosyltransferase involved in cell wall biosynthesis
MNGKISVIIPAYNTEEYITDCLTSLQNQTYPHFEALVVNDGSTDRTAEIVGKFSEKDQRFVLINQKNRGPSAARNRGLEEANGDFVYFMDSDDYIAPETFEKCIKQFQMHSQLDIVLFDAAVVFEKKFLDKKSNVRHYDLSFASYYDRTIALDSNSVMTPYVYYKNSFDKIQR